MKRLLTTFLQGVFAVWISGFAVGWIYYGWQIDHEQSFGVAMLTGGVVAGGKAIVWPYTMLRGHQQSLEEDEKRAYWNSILKIQEIDQLPDSKVTIARIQEDRKLKGDHFADDQMAIAFDSICVKIKKIRSLFVAIKPPESYKAMHAESLDTLDDTDKAYAKVSQAARAHNNLALSLAFDNFESMMESHRRTLEFTAIELQKYGPSK